jgi:hypothetical protein
MPDTNNKLASMLGEAYQVRGRISDFKRRIQLMEKKERLNEISRRLRLLEQQIPSEENGINMINASVILQRQAILRELKTLTVEIGNLIKGLRARRQRLPRPQNDI